MHARLSDDTTAISSMSRDLVTNGSIVMLLLCNLIRCLVQKPCRGSDSRSEGLVALVQLPTVNFANTFLKPPPLTA